MISHKPYIAKSPEQLIMRNTFVELSGLSAAPVILKYEGYNAAGSIKMKSALSIIDHAEASGTLKPGGELIESSSGNLGIALSIICASRNYRFTCVTDPNATENAKYLIKATGANLIVVDKRDANGGYLATRIELIKQMCRDNPGLIWTNQYSSEANVLAHYATTAPEILSSFPHVDWLFVGAGTTGTLMGCIRYFNQFSPCTKVIAVDSRGSVTFGDEKATRCIPGIGTSRVPPICDHSLVKEVCTIDESVTVKECRHWASQGYLFGGSTGSVLAAVRELSDEIRPDDVVVVISPDGGEKYLSTIYNPNWVEQNLMCKEKML